LRSVYLTTMKERSYFHDLWCSTSDAWMANGYVSLIKKQQQAAPCKKDEQDSRLVTNRWI
jgi:hypothetical protein